MAISPRFDAITLKCIDFESLLCLCETSKSLYSLLTNIHRDVPKNESKLFKHQFNRFYQVREKLYHEDRKVNHYDYMILEDTFIKIDNLQIYKFCAIDKINNQKPVTINIAFRYKNDDEVYINLSERCKRAIFATIRQKRPLSYNCVDFIMESVGRYKPTAPNCLDGNWIEAPLDESTLIAGDIVALLKRAKYKHFAIYAINGVYLSKFGSGYNYILPATLPEMMKAYKATRSIKLINY